MNAGKNYGAFAPSTSSTALTSATAVDASLLGVSNWEHSTDATDAPFCTETATGSGYSVTGCVQQPAMAYSGGRWFIGYPQKASLSAVTNAYDFFNIMVNMGSTINAAFATLGNGLGFLHVVGAPYQVARNVQYAVLSSGKVVATYSVYQTTVADGTGGSELYASVYNPTTATWGAMTQLSTGTTTVTADNNETAYIENTTKNINWFNYNNDNSGMAGNHCRPKVAASGNRAMAVWCERHDLNITLAAFTDWAAHVRYAIYDGTQWLDDANTNVNTNSATLMAITDAGGSGMNNETAVIAVDRDNSAAAPARQNGVPDLITTYHPGMARRIAVSAFVPNGLFLARPGIAEVDVVFPIPKTTQFATDNPFTPLAGANFCYPGNAGTCNLPAEHGLVTNAFIGANAITAIAAANDFLFVSESTADVVDIWYTMPTAGGANSWTIQLAGDNAGVDVNDAAGLATDGTRLVVSNTGGVGATDTVKIWNTIPTASTTAESATVTGLNDPRQVCVKNNKLFVAEQTTGSVRIWNTVPSSGAANLATDDDVTLTYLTAPRAVWSDGVRPLAGGTVGQ